MTIALVASEEENTGSLEGREAGSEAMGSGVDEGGSHAKAEKAF